MKEPAEQSKPGKKPSVGRQEQAAKTPVQNKSAHGELQRKTNNSPRQLKEQQKLSALKTPDKTGLPSQLKSGVEQLSGISMDDVRTHYNSPLPAQLQAHAYAQGTDIHLAPGQEKHLPHEAWHVVQQKQGRVRPTMQLKKGVPVNDDPSLEKEADVMGAKALVQKKKADHLTRNIESSNSTAQLMKGVGNLHAVSESNMPPVQLVSGNSVMNADGSYTITSSMGVVYQVRAVEPAIAGPVLFDRDMTAPPGFNFATNIRADQFAIQLGTPALRSAYCTAFFNNAGLYATPSFVSAGYVGGSGVGTIPCRWTLAGLAPATGIGFNVHVMENEALGTGSCWFMGVDGWAANRDSLAGINWDNVLQALGADAAVAAQIARVIAILRERKKASLDRWSMIRKGGDERKGGGSGGGGAGGAGGSTGTAATAGQ